MEDHMMSTATEKREDDNGGSVEMRDNGDGRQGWRRCRLQTSRFAEMRDSRDAYSGKGYSGQKKKDMWDNRDGEMGWKDRNGQGKY